MSFRDWTLRWSSRESGTPPLRCIRPRWRGVLLLLGILALVVAVPPYSLHNQRQHLSQLQHQGEQLQELDRLLLGGQAIADLHLALDNGDIYALAEIQRQLSRALSLLVDGDVDDLAPQHARDLTDVLSLYLRMGSQQQEGAPLPPLNARSDRDIIAMALQGLEARYRDKTRLALADAAQQQQWLVTHYLLSAIVVVALVISVLLLRDQSRRIRQQVEHIDKLEGHFERLLADLPGYWLALSLDGVILHASRSVAEKLISSTGELRGTRFDGLLPALYREQFKRYVRNLNEGRQPEPLDVLLEDSWGRQHPVAVEAGHCRMPEGDALLVLLRDVSLEHELATRCERIQNRGEMLSRAVPGALWEWDGQRDEVRGNGVWYQWLGLSDDNGSVSPTVFFERVHADDRERVATAFRAFLGGRERELHIEHRLAGEEDGHYREVACRAVAQRDGSGRVLAMVGVHSDITAFRQTEREHTRLCRSLEDRVRLRTLQLEEAVATAEAANRAKSTFLAVMGHEVRTPMNGVVGMTELLAKTQLDREQQMMLNTIQRSSVSLLNTLDNILDYAAIEAGRLQLDPQPVQLLELLEGVADDFAATAARNGQHFSVRFHPQLPLEATVDPLRLRQSLGQLLDNAFKFAVYASPRGCVELLVGIEAGDTDGDRLTCRVRDNGIGVAAEIREQLFQPFFQAESSRTRRFSGTGLGLALAARVAELMNGSVTLESEPGEATCFKLSLPLVECKPRDLPSPVDSDALLYVLIENQVLRGDVESALKLHGIKAKSCLDSSALANKLSSGVAEKSANRRVLIDGNNRQVMALCRRHNAEVIRLVARPLGSAAEDVVAQQQVFVDPLLPSALLRVLMRSSSE